MNNISIIIPVHEYNDKMLEYLTKAFDSIVAQEGIDELPQTLIVFPTAIETEIKEFVESQIRKHQDKGITHKSFYLVNNFDKTDYQSQVNLAVKSVNTPYFSVLEFDDEYGKAYIKNAEKYIASYSDIDVFLTMMIEVNDRNEGVKITNETVWAQQFVGENGEMGYLNLNALKQYTDFKLSGAVIKKSEFENLGGYKSNIKLTFMYEFLLRALNNACKIFSIPKIGYKHLFNREGSLFDVYSKTMPVNERKFWFETATKESNFPKDRMIDMSLLKK
jgi:hypothetical protein